MQIEFQSVRTRHASASEITPLRARVIDTMPSLIAAA